MVGEGSANNVGITLPKCSNDLMEAINPHHRQFMDTVLQEDIVTTTSLKGSVQVDMLKEEEKM